MHACSSGADWCLQPDGVTDSHCLCRPCNAVFGCRFDFERGCHYSAQPTTTTEAAAAFTTVRTTVAETTGSGSVCATIGASGANAQTACIANADCTFSWGTGLCQDRVCSDIWDEAECEGAGLGCEYLAELFACNVAGAPVHCTIFLVQAECPTDRCFFEAWSCQPCDAVAGCPGTWNATTVAVDTTTGTATNGMVCSDLETCNDSPEWCILDPVTAVCRSLRCADNWAEEVRQPRHHFNF